MINPPPSAPPTTQRLSFLRRRPPKTVLVHTLFNYALVWLGWAVVGALLVVILFRLLAWDEIQIFAMADALGSPLYLPAWIVAVGAAAGRRWALLGAAVVVVAAQLVFGLPEFTAATPVPTGTSSAFTLRLFDANVYQSNPSMSGYAAQLRADRPDLVTMEEASFKDRLQLERADALTSLTHVFEVYRDDSRAFLLASRYPLGPATVSSIDGLPFLVRTTLRIPGQTIPLWVVHTTAPVNPGWHMWYEELQRVDQLLIARRPGPLLMVGDFNATWGNRWFRAILNTGLSDAAAARGEPLDMTWSQMFFVLPPLIRVDHVLTTPDVVVTAIHSGPGPGSDHRDLTATIAFLGARHRRSSEGRHSPRPTRSAATADG